MDRLEEPGVDLPERDALLQLRALLLLSIWGLPDCTVAKLSSEMRRKIGSKEKGPLEGGPFLK
jgi:hypothetical protein